MTREQNDALRRVGPGPPARQLLRKYWQPIVLAEELTGPRPLKAVRVLGLDLIVFRGPDGRLGLLDRDCPHRGADLAFGRLEDGGVRRPFHGRLLVVGRQYLEIAGEAAESGSCSRER